MPPRPLRPLARRLTPGAGSYWALARTPRHALVFALPLLLAYEALAALLGEITGLGVRNGADVWLKAPFALLFGARGPVLFGALMVGGAAVVVWRDVRRAARRRAGAVLAGMLAESVVMAVVCALVVGAGHRAAPPRAPGAATVAPALAAPALAASDGGLDAMGAPARLMIALGAGALRGAALPRRLVGALLVVARRALGLAPAGASTLAVVLGA
jgi:hypothetical protein